jgi:hypothetical protein
MRGDALRDNALQKTKDKTVWREVSGKLSSKRQQTEKEEHGSAYSQLGILQDVVTEPEVAEIEKERITKTCYGEEYK